MIALSKMKTSRNLLMYGPSISSKIFLSGGNFMNGG
jgi:hypothetical protein